MLLSTCSFFFFNDTATTEIYTLSLHDALPISTKADLHYTVEEFRLIKTTAVALVHAMRDENNKP